MKYTLYHPEYLTNVIGEIVYKDSALSFQNLHHNFQVVIPRLVRETLERTGNQSLSNDRVSVFQRDAVLDSLERYGQIMWKQG